MYHSQCFVSQQRYRSSKEREKGITCEMESFLRGVTYHAVRHLYLYLNQGKLPYELEWYHFIPRRKLLEMGPASVEHFWMNVAAVQEKATKENERGDCFCLVCHKAFRSQNARDNHMRSKKHRKMKAMVDKKTNFQRLMMLQRFTMRDEEMDKKKEVLDLDECLFCPEMSEDMMDNLTHMVQQHSFFLPDLRFIADLEGLLVYLGKMVSQRHMCLWCQERGKVFPSVRAVQKHMVDKGHCKMKHDDSSREQYANFYDYRSSHLEVNGDPGMLKSNGFERVLPSGSTIGHRSLSTFYKQYYGRQQEVMKAKVLSRWRDNPNLYKALGWIGTPAERAKDSQQEREREPMEQQMKQQQEQGATGGASATEEGATVGASATEEEEAGGEEEKNCRGPDSEYGKLGSIEGDEFIKWKCAFGSSGLKVVLKQPGGIAEDEENSFDLEGITIWEMAMEIVMRYLS